MSPTSIAVSGEELLGGFTQGSVLKGELSGRGISALCSNAPQLKGISSEELARISNGKSTADVRVDGDSVELSVFMDYPMLKSILQFLELLIKAINDQPKIYGGLVPATADGKGATFVPTKEDSAKSETKFVPTDAKSKSPVATKTAYNWDIATCWEERQILIPVVVLMEYRVMG
ncbi:MAG: hypothetical protein LBG04_00060 [Holosporaceae bacterium]|jgi:hypothetical protein|nr:hypothetical protein [Holosporaceae bacterium]